MHLSQGQIIFAIVFFIGFVIAMLWAYRKDRNVNRIYYKGVYVVLIVMVVFIAMYNLAVRFLSN